MNPPQVYTCSPSWTPLPHPSPYHPSGSSQCTSPEHPVTCIEPGLAICFTYDIIHVSMPFSQITLPSPSPTESKRLFYTSVSFLLSRIQGYHYHLSKLHIYVLVYYIGVFSFWLTLLCIIGSSFIHLIRTESLKWKVYFPCLEVRGHPCHERQEIQGHEVHKDKPGDLNLLLQPQTPFRFFIN